MTTCSDWLFVDSENIGSMCVESNKWKLHYKAYYDIDASTQPGDHQFIISNEKAVPIRAIN